MRNYYEEEDQWLTYLEFQLFEYDTIQEFGASNATNDIQGYLKLRAHLEAICEFYDNNPLA
jgi:hypothetical protein